MISFTISFLNFYYDANLDIIYDVTIAITWDEKYRQINR